MKRNIAHLIVSVVLLLSAAVTTLAQNNGICSNASAAGTWGYTETGSVILPTGVIPYASVGQFTVDRDGSFVGQRTSSTAGTIQPATIKGTLTVNPDCTGTQTIKFYDPTTGILLSPAEVVKTVVFVDHAREARMIIVSGTPAPVVLTTEAKKLLP
jgi:hypothetical protein